MTADRLGRTLGSGTPHGSMLCTFQVRQQQRQSAIDDDGGVAIRNRVTEQILDAPEPVVGVLLEDLGAIREHRRKPLAQIQTPCVEFSE
jgi:hypothetical protein